MIISIEFLYRIQIKFNLKAASILTCVYFHVPPYARGLPFLHSHLSPSLTPQFQKGEVGGWLFPTTLLDVPLKMPVALSCCPQVNDPALRGGSLFSNQLPGMDMIKQEGDASRVRNREMCELGKVSMNVLWTKIGRVIEDG